MPSHNGIWQWALQNGILPCAYNHCINRWIAAPVKKELSCVLFCILGCYLHPPEDSPGRHGPGIHLSDLWALLPCCYDSREFISINSVSPQAAVLRRMCEWLILTVWIIPAVLYGLWCLSFLQGKMVLQLSKEPSARLLKHVVRCYLRLSDNSRWIDCFLYCDMSDNAKVKKKKNCLALTLLTLPFVLIQSQRSTEAVPPWSAQRHHFCPSLEGRHHHQALAGPAGEEPAGGTGHRSQRHSSSSTVTSPPSLTFPTRRTPAQNCRTA